MEERLRSLLGLNSYEARAYLHLLRHGPQRPREVARGAGIPYQRIYDVLESLASRGLVVQAGEGVYAAREPSRALSVVAEHIIDDARRRAEEIRRLGLELEEISKAPHHASLSLVNGVPRVFAEAVEAVRRCQGQVYVLAYKGLERAEELKYYIESLAIEASRSGVPGVRVLAARGLDIPDWLEEAARGVPLEVSFSDAVFLDLMVACDTVIIGLPGPGGVVAVVVRNREFAEALKERVEALWAREAGAR